MMLKFYPATIVSKEPETEDSILVTLSVPDEALDAFHYSQGQHLPIRVQIDGADVRRTYSICSSVNDNKLRLAIRMQGAASTYIGKKLAVGDTLEVMPPSGHFQTDLDATQTRTYVAFVAGSGITPILSIVKTTLETERESRFIIFYGNRKRSTTMFIEELYGLKNLYPERLSLHFIMSREEGEIPVYSGRIDRVKVKLLHQTFLGDLKPDDVFICGPNPMIDDITESLVELGYNSARIHSERFRTEALEEADEKQDSTPAAHGNIEVTVTMDGNRQSFQMTDDSQSLLDAALDNEIELPYSCMGGVCSTCRTLLVKGKVNMAINYALEDWELKEGYILTCQSRPETAEIELDYDQT